MSHHDALHTALEVLQSSDPDVEGRRVQAERETRAALEALGDWRRDFRSIPYEGAPRLEVALELLERSLPSLRQSKASDAVEHVERASEVLRLAVRRP